MLFPNSRNLMNYGCVALLASTLIVGSTVAQPRITPVKPGDTPSSPGRQAAPCNGLQTIENDRIRVGINTCYGGAITYLAFVNNKNVNGENMVNNPDLGRSVQIALYSGPKDYSSKGAQAWTGLGWDPVQAGDVYNNPSQVVTFEKKPNLIYVKTIPNQFALNNEPGEATIEHWIQLQDNVVKVHARVVMNRSDHTQYEARQQEMPCVYLNGDYHNIWYYKGGAPFTNGQPEHIVPPIDFGDTYPTEPWMASTNNNGYGVGLYLRNNFDFKNGYFGSDLGGNEFSNDASYIAATNFVLLDYNLVHEWDYELVLGNITDIRSYIYSQPRPASGPNYRFDTSRKGWFYHNAKDTGFPITGKLHVILSQATLDEIKSPYVFWKGKDNPKIYLRAAFQTQNDRFRLSWRQPQEKQLVRNPDRQLDFAIINDGQPHTYEIDLSNKPGWIDGNIGQIEFQPITEGPAINGWAEIEWIATSNDGPKVESATAAPAIPLAEVACEPGCVQITVRKTLYTPSNRKR